jgi:hypothetical protein
MKGEVRKLRKKSSGIRKFFEKEVTGEDKVEILQRKKALKDFAPCALFG